MLVIINYGLGNSSSVLNMIRKIGGDAKVSSKPADILDASRLIIPGVGSFDHGINQLHTFGLYQPLQMMVLKGIPILGICLGMQLFAKSSEEGKLPGLGWIEADVKRFDFSKLEKPLKVPHIGWNEVSLVRDHPLFDEIPFPMRFYFVHSYHYVCASDKNVLGATHYGYDFPCAVMKDNIIGVQFHPEKSHKFGMQLLKNFVEKC